MARYNIKDQAQTLLNQGWSEAQIIALAPNQDIQHTPEHTWTYNGKTHSTEAEWFAWNRDALEAIDQAVADLEEKVAAKQDTRPATPATARQIAYIESLIIDRKRSGEGGGFMGIPEDLSGISKADASRLIDSLTGNY